MIGNRTLLSLAQYLNAQRRELLAVLFEKHGLKETWDESSGFSDTTLQGLITFLRAIPSDRLLEVIEEIVATEPDLRAHVVNQWGDGADAYDARWSDLQRCLALDDLAISKGRLMAVEPNLQGASHVEDALTAAISSSGLPNAPAIVSLLERSARAFQRVPPDYNACLGTARAALETLAKDIALARQKRVGDTFQPDKWGQVITYLRTSKLVTESDESLITSVYTFISPGAHQPIGLSEEEMVRLGRGMAVSICYFLVKLHSE